MEASAFEAPAGIARTRVTIGVPLLRLRSDEQLVALFRDGHDDAFRVIHDRYHKRLLAYMRQMLPRRPDAEDALQEVFVRAYFGLRAHDRDLSLRSWLFRVAHNRCIDELRRPAPPPPEILELVRCTIQDPVAEAERRESLRRLIADVRRLPEQQRSALLMRELGGMSYADLAATLEVSVPAVKSLLVRARVGLARAAEARDTACSDIRETLVEAHDQGVRPAAMARRHMRDCTGCRSFRRELRGISRGLAALAPTWGPVGAVAKLLGSSGGAGGGAGGGSAALGAVGAGGTASSAGIAIGANHVVALIAAAVATGGAIEIQPTSASAPPAKHPASRASSSRPDLPIPAVPGQVELVVDTPSGQIVVVPAASAAVPTAVAAPARSASRATHHSPKPSSGLGGAVTGGSSSAASAVESPPPSDGSASGSSSSDGSTSAGPTAVLGDGTVPGTGSGSAGSGSTSGTSSSSGSSTSGSSSSSSGSGTNGSTSVNGTNGSTSGSGSSTSGSGTSSSGSGSPPASTSSAGSSGSQSSTSGSTSSSPGT